MTVSFLQLEHVIREQDPLKQGLKLISIHNFTYILVYSRARSIKTRIETKEKTPGLINRIYSRARSIKTRIETSVGFQCCRQFGNIREQDPLKQGLKHVLGHGWFYLSLDSRARSIKTRIETSL